MSSEKPSGSSLDTDRWLAQHHLIDLVCRSYEVSLESGTPVGIRQFLASRVGEFHRELFYEVLVVELTFRVSKGETPDLEMYLRQFGDWADQVGKAFETITSWGLIPPDNNLPGTVRDAAEKSRGHIGDYFLKAEIGRGEGALAKVYVAEDLAGREVAIKISDRPSVEGNRLKRLNHPHIVKLYHCSQLQGEPVRHLVCMEYIKSISLRAAMDWMSTDYEQRSGEALVQLLKARVHQDAHSPLVAQMDWPTFVAWFGARVASAVAHAHSQDVQHRDLKPANILLDRFAHPKLVDFNVSFVSDDRPNPLGTPPADFFGGSLPYMAPEHLEAFATSRFDCDIGKAADVFSLGVVLFEMLVGHRPVQDQTFSAPTLTEIADALRMQIEKAPAQIPFTCSRELHWIIQQCLQLDANLRPSAEELSRRLQYVGSPEHKKLVVPVYRYGETILPRFAAAVYLALLIGVCFLPTVPVLIVGALLYHSLVLSSIPGAIDIWDMDVAWQAGNVCGTIGVVLVIIVSVLYLAPIVKAIATTDRGLLSRSLSTLVASRCFSMGLVAAAATVVAWSLIGLAIPLTVIFSGKGNFGPLHVLDNVLQSTLHGLIGFTPTFLLATSVSIEFLMLRLIPRAEMSGSVTWIELLKRLVPASRLIAPAAASALIFRALMQARETPDVRLYVQALVLLLLAYSVLTEFLAIRFEVMLSTARSVLELDRTLNTL